MEPLTKSSLRAAARARLAALSPETRTAASLAICRQIVALPQWAAARTIALFAAQPSEPNLTSLLQIDGKTFCFPIVSSTDAMEFHGCNSLHLLRPGEWKVLEPDPAGCPLIPPSDIDILLIPGLAFTASGHRLGRGRGHYDRFLSRIRPGALKIGICFHTQLFPHIPIESHDLSMNLVLTGR